MKGASAWVMFCRQTKEIADQSGQSVIGRLNGNAVSHQFSRAMIDLMDVRFRKNVLPSVAGLYIYSLHLVCQNFSERLPDHLPHLYRAPSSSSSTADYGRYPLYSVLVPGVSAMSSSSVFQLEAPLSSVGDSHLDRLDYDTQSPLLH